MKNEITYDNLLEEIPNKYILTIVAGDRARELATGSKSLTKCKKKDTIIKKALKEILDDKVGFEVVEAYGE